MVDLNHDILVPLMRTVRWYDCGCMEVEDGNYTETESFLNNDGCGDEYPHGAMTQEILVQRDIGRNG